jgi:hypothetical protein
MIAGIDFISNINEAGVISHQAIVYLEGVPFRTILTDDLERDLQLVARNTGIEIDDSRPWPVKIASTYSIEVIKATARVARILDKDCDRCDLADLLMLQEAGLMATDVCQISSDTLHEGDEMWVFTAAGNELAAAIIEEK